MTNKIISDFSNKSLVEDSDLILIETTTGEYKYVTALALKNYLLDLNPQVIMLLPFDVDFEDVAGNKILVKGNPVISTDNSKFGGEAIFNGNGDYLQADYVSQQLAGKNQWTIRGWFRLNNNNSSMSIVSFNTLSGNNRLLLYYEPKTPSSLRIYKGNTYKLVDNLTVGEYYHFELGFSDGVVEVFLNGVSQASVSVSISSSDKFSIGQDFDGTTTSDFFDGALDDIQIIKNKKMNSKNFIPPTNPYTLSI